MFNMIVAADLNDVIGLQGDLPWHLPADLLHFKMLTADRVLIAGRKTHDSIVAKLGQTLPHRYTVVVSREPREAVPGAVFVTSVEQALRVAEDISVWGGTFEVFIIGGAEIYMQTLDQVEQVFLTRVHTMVENGDARLPEGWLADFDRDTLYELEEPDGQKITFETYSRRSAA